MSTRPIVLAHAAVAGPCWGVIDVEALREWLVANSTVQSRALCTTAQALSAIVRYRQCPLGFNSNFVVEGVFSKIQNCGSACDLQ
jgi:hypothetical protein